MATTKKLIQAAAGAAGGAGGLNVEEVFSTYLYDGNDAAQTITNGIDLSGEGGLVWLKNRGFTVDGTTGITDSHQLIDTERGASYRLITNTTSGNNSATNYFSSFNSDGFTVGTNMSNGFDGGHRYTSWTFRKAPKFFDVVTYTGDGTSATSRNIPHNLGCTPGFIVLKRLDSATNWEVNALNSSGSYERLRLNLTNATSGTQTGHTDTTFHTITSSMNASGGSYVAYLFAHNDGDASFGPDGDLDIIKCGSYTGNSSINEIDLGFEAQWVLIKSTTDARSWMLYDAMRGMVSLVGTSSDAQLSPDTSGDEVLVDTIAASANGFTLENSSLNTNRSAKNYIYIAIRRGPMAVPESATDVFDVQTAGNLSGLYSTSTGFTPDTAFYRDRDSNQNNIIQARLTETQLITNSTASEFTSYNSHLAGNQDGIRFDSTQNYGSSIIYQWKRAPNYFDVVAYTGNGTRGLTVSHNLGVAPEMMWVKGRNNAFDWTVYHKDAAASGTVAESSALELNNANAVAAAGYVFWDNTAPTSSVITLGNNAQVNQSGYNYIAYLFASVDGVSKVGSYTSDGTDGKVIDCGFTSGARFVLIKGASVATNWLLWDSERGIVAGNDPFLELNTTDTEDTGTDYIDPHSSGFIVNSGINFGSNTFIFYAIA
jgi:hypothetical protein